MCEVCREYARVFSTRVMSLSVYQTLTRGWERFPRRIQQCCSAIKVEQSLLASFVVKKLVSQWSINPYLSTEGVGALNSHIFQPKWCRGWRTPEGRVKGKGGAITRPCDDGVWDRGRLLPRADSYIRACWWFMTAPRGNCVCVGQRTLTTIVWEYLFTCMVSQHRSSFQCVHLDFDVDVHKWSFTSFLFCGISTSPPVQPALKAISHKPVK